jgi:probable F420-dependent oxidoreductase
MALKDQISFGMSLPHRSPDPIAMSTIRNVARRSDALGFADLWVTENTIDEAYSFDPAVILTYAAAVTTRIKMGTSVVVLPLRSPIHVAHTFASLDYVSNGRAILGVGLGREHYEAFQVPSERRVRRFREQVEMIRALWSGKPISYDGEIFHLDAGFALQPVQAHLPIWFGGTHPAALRRAAVIADGWMGAGGQSTESFGQSVVALKAALESAGRDPSEFPISKRIFMSVHDDPAIAKAEVHRWFTEVYHNPGHTERNGVYGTPEQVRERLHHIVDMGANHLLLNPVARYEQQVEVLASVVGLT